MRLGGMETIKVDVRIIAATNVRSAADDGGGPLPRRSLLPPARHLDSAAAAARSQGRYSAPVAAFPRPSTATRIRRPDSSSTPEALDLLTDYDWPGNVRELENVIERAVVLTPGRRIGVELIPDHVRKTPNFNVPRVRHAARRHPVQGGHHRLREAAHRVDARSGRRRAEARRRAPAHQADDAQRDDQAVRHPLRGAKRRRSGTDRRARADRAPA